LTTGNPVYLISTEVHGGCDRSAEDAYSSMAPEPISGVTRGPGKPGFDCGLFRLPDVDILILTADCSVTNPNSQILKLGSRRV
jgi:hypothetical protein